MRTSMQNLTGEELLLMSVLGGPKDRAAVERELDRRSSMSLPPRTSCVHTLNWAPVQAPSGLQVA